MTDSDPYLASLRENRAAVAEHMRSLIQGVEARAARGGLDTTTPAEEAALRQDDAALDRYAAEITRYTEMRAKLADGDDLAEQISGANARAANSDVANLQSAFVEARAGRTATFDSSISNQLLEARALATTSATFSPTTLADFITVYERTASPMLDPGVVRVLSTADGAPIVLPRETADVTTGGTVTAEAAAITEHDPTVSSVQLGAFGFKSITLWSNELDTDGIAGLREMIANANARPITLDAGTMLTTGTGTVQPWGIVTRASIAGTASGTATFGASATFFGWGDLVTLMFSVASPYRKRGSFMVSTDAFSKIAQMRDNNNQPVLLQGVGGLPDTVLGRPIYENPAMAAVGSGSKSVLFGDLGAYVTRRVNPVRITVSPEYKFNTDQVAVRVVDRLDGDLIDTAAVKVLVSAAS